MFSNMATWFVGQASTVPSDLQLLDQLKGHGVLALIAGVLYLGVKVLRHPTVQLVLGALSPKLLWINWSKWFCVLVVFLVSFLGLVVDVFVGGGAFTVIALITMLVKAAVAAAMAMGGDAAVSAIAKAKTIPDPQ